MAFAGTVSDSLGGTGNSIIELDSGNYTVTATNTVTGCVTDATFSIGLDDIGVNPAITLVTKTADAFCDNTGERGDGTVEIAVSEDGSPANLANYTIEWYRGNSTDPDDQIFPAEGANTLRGSARDVSAGSDFTQLDSLASGNYTVVVTKDPATAPNAGCSVTSVFNITIDQPTLTIAQADVNSQDNQNCANPNGYVTITAVSEDGNNALFPLSDYAFAWEKDGVAFVDGTDGSISDSLGAVGNSIINLFDGVYSVTATNTITGCVTNATINITVEDSTINPSIQLVENSADSYCDPDPETGDGVLEVSIGTAAGIDINEYFFRWWVGSDTLTSANEITNQSNFGGTIDVQNSDSSRLVGLPAGIYTVAAFDVNDPYNGCATIATYNVVEDTVNYEIRRANVLTYANTNCDATQPNGGVRITDILRDNVSVDLQNNGSDYAFTWVGLNAEAVQVTTASGAANDSVNSIAPGTYTLLVENLNPNLCQSLSLEITIEDEPSEPNVFFEASNDDTYCVNIDTDRGPNFAIGSGSLYLDLYHAGDTIDDPNGTVILNTDYIIEWYKDLADPTVRPGIGDPNFLFDNQGNLGNFEFVGTAQPDTIGGIADFTRVDSLTEGNYTIFVQKTATAINPNDQYRLCGEIATYEVGDSSLDPDQISISQPIADADYTFGVGKNDNFNCDPTSFNGYIEITEVIELTTSVTGAGLDNYDFEWFMGDLSTPFNDPANGSIVDGANGTNTRIENIEGGIYLVRATNRTTGCIAEEVSITIEDRPIDPVIDFVDKTASTFCNAAAGDGNGTLEVAFSETPGPFDAANYEIRWYRGTTVDAAQLLFSSEGEPATATVGDAINNGFTQLTGLSVGFYTIAINKVSTSPNLGCSTERTFEITEDLQFPNFNVPEGQLVHNTICSPIDGDAQYDGNGSISIRPANFNNPANPPVTDLTNFDWDVTYTTAGGAISAYVLDNAAQGTANGTWSLTATEIRMEGLEPGVYGFVAADAGTGCQAASINVEIRDESIDPALGQINIYPDLSCITNKDQLTDAGDGAIKLVEIDLDGSGSVASLPDANYEITWFIGNDTSTPLSNNTNFVANAEGDSIAGLVEGIYTVEVRDLNTNCTSTQQIEVFREEVTPYLTNFEVNNNTFCAPNTNGSIVVLEGSYQGQIINFNPDIEEDTLGNILSISYPNGVDTIFSVQWFESDGTTPLPTEPADDVTPFEYEGLAGGTYYAGLRRNEDQCASELVEITILDNPFIPEINIVTLQADSTCAPNGYPNGQFAATASGATDDDGFSFTWYNENDLSTIVGTGDTLSNLVTGTYILEVYDSLTGCSNQAEVFLDNIPPVTEILDFAVTDPTQCVPANGTVEILEVSNNQIDRFVFDIYNEDPGRPISGTPAPILTIDSANLVFGERDSTYYIVGRDTLTGCTTTPLQVEFGDNTPDVDINLVSFTFQTNCDPARANGTITINANGVQDTALYSPTWYDSLGNVVEVNSFTADSLSAGDYTVIVTDLTSGCTFEAVYPMADDVDNPFEISATTSPNANCINPNGRLSVTIIDPRKPSFVYRYLWKIGTETPTESDFDYEGQLVENVASGEYTVVVIDTDDRFCESIQLTVTVEDVTVEPEFSLEQTAPLTNCDPLRPNGRARALLPNDDFFRYEFEWYVGTDTAGVEPYETGIEADSLFAITYGVVIKDVLTGCRNFETITIEDATVPPPVPDVTIGNNRTNCLRPNGTAFASVGGDVLDYTFTWYSFSDPNTPLGTGASINILDVGAYLVTTTSNETGCTSGATPLEILDEREPPVFTVETEISECGMDNGIARLIFERGFTEIDSVVWYHEGQILEGPTTRQDVTLADGPPGNLSVWIRDGNGCDYQVDFEIGTDIVVYNGVSDNNDGLNDIFLIDCIDFFPNNNVKIFNRAGVLIYEVDGYDNANNFFNGYSNVYGGSIQAEGTYFYIIDKGDGSDLIQGYLELTR